MRLIDADALLQKQYRIDDSATLSTRDVVNVEDIEDASTVCNIEQSAILMRKLYEEYEHNLEQIRAEIQENINYNKKMDYQGIVAGLLLTLNIIDKHTEGDTDA